MEGEDGVFYRLHKDIGGVESAIVIAHLVADLLVAVKVDDKNQQVPVGSDVGLTRDFPDSLPQLGVGQAENAKLLHEHAG